MELLLNPAYLHCFLAPFYLCTIRRRTPIYEAGHIQHGRGEGSVSGGEVELFLRSHVLQLYRLSTEISAGEALRLSASLEETHSRKSLIPQARPWAHLLHETSAKDFIKLTTSFIVVRLGKGVILSFVLLTFTIHFNHLEPSFEFVCLTLSYFILTQYQSELSSTSSCRQTFRLPCDIFR